MTNHHPCCYSFSSCLLLHVHYLSFIQRLAKQIEVYQFLHSLSWKSCKTSNNSAKLLLAFQIAFFFVLSCSFPAAANNCFSRKFSPRALPLFIFRAKLTRNGRFWVSFNPQRTRSFSIEKTCPGF